MRRGNDSPEKRVARLREKQWDSIVAKCHPAIFELGRVYKEFSEAQKSIGPNAPRELIESLETRLDKQLEEIERKYSGPAQPAPNQFAAQIIFSDAALKSESDTLGNAELLHWARHKVPLKQDLERIESRDWEATRRFSRTNLDWERLRCGKGPIQPFKGDTEHSEMFQGFWGFGIEKLAPEELAEFFDAYCPCGRDHDAKSLANQKRRLARALSAG